jgi:hypothetical protein
MSSMINITIAKSKRSLPILLVGIILVFIGVIYRFSVDIQELFEDKSIEQEQMTIEKYRSFIATEKQLTAQVTEGRRILTRAQRLVMQADTPALAAVEIQDRINQFAVEQGVVIESMRFLEPMKVELPELAGYLAIPVQFSLDAPLRKTIDLLYKIETADKLLTVQEMRVQAKGQPSENRISASFVICGYMPVKNENNAVGPIK